MADRSVEQCKVLPGFKIAVTFRDGTSGVADLSPRLTQGPLGDAFDALCDEHVFAQVSIQHGALTWRAASTWRPTRCMTASNRPASPS